MSDPQPILATHLIKLDYHALGLTHVKQLYVDAIVDAGTTSGYALVMRDASLHNDWTACIAAFAGKFKVFFASTDTIQSAILYAYVGGVYQPLSATSLGVAGTGGSSGAICNQVTLFGRSADYDIWKDIALDTDNATLDHGPASALSGPVGAYLADFGVASSTHIGNWVRSKSATFFGNWVSYTVSFNRKLRKERGLV